jgi:choline dehydrogenase
LRLLAVVKGAVLAFTRTRDLALFERLKSDVEGLFGLMGRDLNKHDPDPADPKKDRRDQEEGAYQIPLAITNNKRQGPREFLLDTVRRGHPLTIKTGAYVTRVVFEDAPGPDGKLRAIGVEFRDGKHLYKADPNAVQNPETVKRRVIKATREVILAAASSTR